MSLLLHFGALNYKKRRMICFKLIIHVHAFAFGVRFKRAEIDTYQWWSEWEKKGERDKEQSKHFWCERRSTI